MVISCKKEAKLSCEDVKITAPASEVTTLKNYITTNNITATEDPRGFFYRIEVAGGAKPSSCADVTVDYIGKLTNGTTFDSGNDISFNLRGLITGWQEGIPLVGEGGRIILYLPPSLAYGSASVGSIPPNSNLIFTITLKSID